MSNSVFQENEELSFHNQPCGSQASLYIAWVKLQMVQWSNLRGWKVVSVSMHIGQGIDIETFLTVKLYY